MLKRLFKKQINNVLDKFDKSKILKVSARANFFGLESKKSRQLRGNGILILTKNELYFSMFLSKKVIEIPISSIKSIETPRSFLKKSYLMRLLKINFIDELGQENSVAWVLENLDEWIEILTKLMKSELD
ncbi:MAG: hypothetical protein ACTSUX_10070 [Promethearchaeota archaeon]